MGETLGLISYIQISYSVFANKKVCRLGKGNIQARTFFRVNSEKECRKEFVGFGRVLCGANRTTGIFIIVLAMMVVSGLGAPSPQGSLRLHLIWEKFRRQSLIQHHHQFILNFYIFSFFLFYSSYSRNSAIRISPPSYSTGQNSLLTSARKIHYCKVFLVLALVSKKKVKYISKLNDKILIFKLREEKKKKNRNLSVRFVRATKRNR